MKKSSFKNKSITMEEVFRDLPLGYWRYAKGETIALRDMNEVYLNKVREFLFSKKEWTELLGAHHISTDIWDDDDIPKRIKNPTDLQYIIKIIEINVELKRRQEEV
jgi:hypothetical protein